MRPTDVATGAGPRAKEHARRIGLESVMNRVERTGTMTNLSAEQLAAISRLFSSGVLRELARTGKSPIFARLARQSASVSALSASVSVGELFDAAFAILGKEGFRHEYIYKAALAHRILLGTHSLQTASMLNEFRVANRKVDVAILNGTATAYEVKSERDSLTRLCQQVIAYAKVFARVYVVASEIHVDDVIKIVPVGVGVMRLSCRNQISTLREAVERPEHTSPVAIFDSIRILEARMILLELGISIPDVPNTQLHSTVRHLFANLAAREVHQAMVKTLKKTRNLQPLAHLVEQLPTSLQPAALLVPLRKLDHQRLVAAVNTPLREAMAWA